ncbi:MAG: cytochrome c3 family protein [Alphaproteobacteria bacterium]|nr:cytochrome c3 family protein [Alphaproteobacteria bacterium]
MKIRLAVIFMLLGVITPVGGGVVYAALGDLVFEREAGVEGSEAFPPSIFPHWVHRVRYRCYACHPAPFAMEQGANKISMEVIKKGEYCGACHNGRTAFSVEFKNCARCHREPPED